MKQIDRDSIVVTGLLRKKFYIAREYALVEILKQPVAKAPKPEKQPNKFVASIKERIAKIRKRVDEVKE